MRKAWKNSVVYGCLLVLLWGAACNPAHAFWPFTSSGKAYSIEGLEGDEDTRAFLQSVIDSHFSKKIEGENEEEEALAVAYRERLVLADLQRAVKSRGYYGAEISYADMAQEKRGVYSISLGKRAVITSVTITPERYSKDLAQGGIKSGDALVADQVIKTQSDLYNKLQKDSCAFDLAVTHKAVMNPQSGKAQIIYEVNIGKEAIFGGSSFKGLESVRESYLRKFIPWKEGECFRRSQIDELKVKLLSTGLFSRAEIILPQDAQGDGFVPIIIDVKERAQRSVRTGLSYYTDEGVGAVIGWEHRNAFGAGEKVNVDLSLSILEQVLEATLNKPYFLRNDQDLSFNSSIGREDNDAYEKISTGGGFRITRNFNKRLSGSAGADIELSRITEENNEDNPKIYGLLSPTGGLKYDSRNDTLDPSKGWLATYNVTPFIDVLGESSPFIKNEMSAQHYMKLHERLTFAARVKMGMIGGTRNDDVPATERFFAGGGGSVRGFGYQEIGPQENGDPVGGRSLIETSAELRFRITDKIGAVAFIDAGDVGKKMLPEYDAMSIGAGVGARYYTDFGPVRFDVGVPMNNRDEVDQNFQVYISIGQAF